MEERSWQTVWRDGFAPGISDNGLIALHDALAADNDRLIQGATTVPPPMDAVLDWACEGACVIGFACWGGERKTVREVEVGFAKACADCDARMGEPAACRWFLNWADDTPRNEFITEMLAEVEREQERRAGRPVDLSTLAWEGR